MKVKIGVSARHVHLRQEELDILFGENYELTRYKNLSQKLQYASNEKVNIKTEKGEIQGLRILGPVREYTQVEISKTDAYQLGINPPVRKSGDLNNAEEVTIIGPNGSFTLPCCIIAIRHIHINKEERQTNNISDVVALKKDGVRGGILENVVVKEDEDYVFECHIDLDDANAFNIKDGEELEIV